MLLRIMGWKKLELSSMILTHLKKECVKQEVEVVIDCKKYPLLSKSLHPCCPQCNFAALLQDIVSLSID